MRSCSNIPVQSVYKIQKRPEWIWARSMLIPFFVVIRFSKSHCKHSEICMAMGCTVQKWTTLMREWRWVGHEPMRVGIGCRMVCEFNCVWDGGMRWMGNGFMLQIYLLTQVPRSITQREAWGLEKKPSGRGRGMRKARNKQGEKIWWKQLRVKTRKKENKGEGGG